MTFDPEATGAILRREYDRQQAASQYAMNTPQPDREPTFMEQVIDRLQEIHASNYDNFRRLEMFADRSLGAIPQDSEVCATPTPTCLTEQVHGLVRDLFRVNNAIREQISRIERIG